MAGREYGYNGKKIAEFLRRAPAAVTGYEAGNTFPSTNLTNTHFTGIQKPTGSWHANPAISLCMACTPSDTMGQMGQWT
jgi:hypothetical protein